MAADRKIKIPPDVLQRVGWALYGNNWQSPLARDLGISDRSMRYMLAGERIIHEGFVADLMKVVEARGAELHEIGKELRKALR